MTILARNSLPSISGQAQETFWINMNMAIPRRLDQGYTVGCNFHKAPLRNAGYGVRRWLTGLTMAAGKQDEALGGNCSTACSGSNSSVITRDDRYHGHQTNALDFAIAHQTISPVNRVPALAASTISRSRSRTWVLT